MIVDWLSFTVSVEATEHEQALLQRAYNSLVAIAPKFATFLFSLEQKPAAARRPYGVAWRYEDIRLYTGVRINHALIEASGQACGILREQGLLDTLLNDVKERVTRVDIAFDILGVSPDEIIEKGYSDVFRTHSRIASDTGVTHYVGSQKSERYARVYRYADPHPRANLCRIELVHKKRYAKIVANEIAQNGLMQTGVGALAAYKFQHDAVPKTEDNVLATVAIVKGSQKTLRWLLVQVAPAFKRLVADGTISDPDEFIRKYFVESLPPSRL
jgi:DNA relaxase NicK